jgi:hypothetical protein
VIAPDAVQLLNGIADAALNPIAFQAMYFHCFRRQC